MTASATQAPPATETSRDREEQRIHQHAQAVRRLGETGAIGTLLVDASFLEEVEQRHGRKAHRTAMKTLHELTERFLKSYFLPDDMIVQSEAGTDELLVLFFRPRSSHRFLVDVLPTLPLQLSDFLSENRSKLARTTDPVGPSRIAVGSSLLLHTPEFHKERELRQSLERAREDADLMRRLHERERRHEFSRIVLERQVRAVYQPIVTLGSRTLHGYEALARGPAESEWAMADQLFTMAERTGLVFELDGLCRASALRGVAHRLGDDRHLFLNCRATALYDPRFRPDTLRQTLETSGLGPEQLVMEISEREFLRSPTAVRETREHMRNLGVKVALDDVGTACSSFGVIMDLDPDYIKVDIQLIRTVETDIGRQEMLHALQTVADRMGASIVAVGVETAEEVAALQRIGVRYGQGYLLGLPDDLDKS